MNNEKLERYLAFITALLIIIIALIIPILARADNDGWVRTMPTTPLLPDPVTVPDPDPTPTPEPTPEPEHEPEMSDEELIRSVITESEEKKLAQTLYGEDRNCGGPEDTMKQAAVIWSIFNRCDENSKTVDEIITHSQYHGWHKNQLHPEWAHEIVRDVALRWAREKAGEENVGRVLPKEYTFFSAGGRHEKFRSGYRTKDYWDWSLPNPYEEEL